MGLAVLEEFRGRGIARQLLKKALEDAKARGKKNVFLFVDAENLAAQKLYASEGFYSKGKTGKLIAGKSVLLLFKNFDETGENGKKNKKQEKMLPAIELYSQPRRDVT